MTSVWLEEARQGGQEAWSRLHRAYRPLVCWWCARGGIPPQDVDDVAQDVFAALAKSLAVFEHESFRGFLWTITRNKIRDYWRGRPQVPQAWGGSSIDQVLANIEAESHRSVGPADQATKVLFDAVVQLIRGEFPDQSWNAFWQVAVEGKPAADVADALGMTRNMVYLARTRILRRIREEFGGGK